MCFLSRRKPSLKRIPAAEQVLNEFTVAALARLSLSFRLRHAFNDTAGPLFHAVDSCWNRVDAADWPLFNSSPILLRCLASNIFFSARFIEIGVLKNRQTSFNPVQCEGFSLRNQLDEKVRNTSIRHSFENEHFSLIDDPN